ncbi:MULTISPECIES: ricin-type beta-trefoil lectin domain protein [unclassified Micromonospora]|uniref:ricin-type beta-trefoil lectin domain protein n=1 Tax=Micromonospora TaxID=1873 RepID=UPI0024166EF6|nr:MULTISPECIES: ricin-type beta-trefoil lectin domain protein [unclassified Micromonospora]MDG4818748.1 ricin-type beta-trefoil lectin domain protein [Micromonospora sp. WMMD956]WFE61306.1 ricin-type beta-trefoil lectin domain protein [Micromonospora sp. WMMD712]
MSGTRRLLRRPSALALLLVGTLLAVGGAVGGLAAPARAATSITINGASGGKTFDGLGAVSGGGGNSRLLIDYPEPQRGQILDYLFKPDYGASLQILKVEIGGDTNSTSGSEPSHSHFRGDLDCNRGYEWWIMEQAKLRNPSIKLVGLAWGAPGWIGNGTFMSQDSIDYHLAWLGCAKQHNLTIDYLTAAQNERLYDANWTINLRTALNNNGYAGVKLIFGDDYPGSWNPANVAVNNAALRNAIDVIGGHYPCGYLAAQTTCTVSANATATGETLWNSEGGSQDYNDGAKPLARGINRGYLDGRMTAYINWNLIGATTTNIPWATVGLMLANQPWSGWYAVGKNAWTLAHTTQFTAPGWKYLDSSSGYIGGARNNGSYVSLKSPNNTDYTTVVETMDATAAQTLDLTVTGGLSTGSVRVWSTNLNSNNTADHFVRGADITPSGGRYSLTVQPGRVYTITTTTGGGKGTATSPPQGQLSLPYSDNFDSYPAGKLARYLQDNQGAFETAACGGGRAGMCLRQSSPMAPITWKTLADPSTYGGNLNWNNYTVSADVLLEKAGYVQLEGRVGSQNLDPVSAQNAYFLRVTDAGAWSILRNNTSNQLTTLRSGTVAALGTNRWHSLALGFSGSTITATVDGVTVGTATDSSFGAGLVGFGTSQGQTAQFDNLSVVPGVGGGTQVALRNTNAGRCLDVPSQSQTNGTQLTLWDCNGGANQQWTQTAGKQLQVYGTKCLDAEGAATSSGTRVIIWDCTGGTNQQWNLNSDGTITGVQSGLCLSPTGGGTANGTQVVIATCTGGNSQKWTRS